MRYRILGPLNFEDGPSPTRGQQARLLGTFLLDPGRILSNVHLAEWALGEERRHEGAQVHVLVARLRRQLREGSMPGFIHTESTGYRFEIDADHIDLTRFEAMIKRASVVRATDSAGSRAALSDAVALWRGDVLAGDGFESHPVVARVTEALSDAVEEQFLIDLELGELGGSLPQVVAASRRRPERERLRVLAMVALHEAGRQTESLALFHDARLHFASLGIEPGAALQEAEVDVLRHDLARTLARLLPNRRGVDRAHRLPTAIGRVTPARMVPQFASSFVGRTQLLAHVRAELLVPGLVTVFGPGGAGKTRLVCEALTRDDSVDGSAVWFAELASLPTDVALSQHLASLFDIRVPAGCDPRNELLDSFRDARGVLVLDSCEAVREAVTVLVEYLLRNCPFLTVVATSRSVIGLAAERLIEASPLTRAEGVELYSHRAIDTDSTFRLSADDAAVVERLCDRLDGLPLAVELAAARIKTFTPSELLVYFDERFALLTTERVGAHRHRSLEATIAWSYALLDETQRRTLRQLAAFAGPVDFAVVESVWVDAATTRASLLKALTELVDRSMVSTSRRGTATSYRLLDNIRTFARDRAAERGDLDELRRRHAMEFAARASTVRTSLRGAHETEAVRTLNAFWPELRAAVAWCVEAKEPSIAIALVGGFGFEAVFRERRELVDWTEQILTIPGLFECSGADEVLGTAAMADWGFGNFDRGWQRAQHAVLLHRKHATPPTPDVLGAYPLHEAMRGDVARGLATLQDHEVEAVAGSVRFSEAHLLCCQAMAHAYTGRPEIAEPLLKRAAAIADTLANPLLQTIVAFTRAIAALDDDPARAVELAGQSLQLAASVRATWFETASMNYLTAALARVGDIGVAVSQLDETLDRLLHGSASQSAANTLRNAVVVLDRLGVPERAAPVVGWLEQTRSAIPGTPGMRNHPALLAERLRLELGETQANELIKSGSLLSLEQVVALAQEQLAASA